MDSNKSIPSESMAAETLPVDRKKRRCFFHRLRRVGMEILIERKNSALSLCLSILTG
jgi:hypothetical protein